MHYSTGVADARSEADLMAEARRLQARHARDLFGAAARRLRSTLARRAGEPTSLDGRRLTLH